MLFNFAFDKSSLNLILIFHWQKHLWVRTIIISCQTKNIQTLQFRHMVLDLLRILKPTIFLNIYLVTNHFCALYFCVVILKANVSLRVWAVAWIECGRFHQDNLVLFLCYSLSLVVEAEFEVTTGLFINMRLGWLHVYLYNYIYICVWTFISYHCCCHFNPLSTIYYHTSYNATLYASYLHMYDYICILIVPKCQCFLFVWAIRIHHFYSM